MHRASKHHMWIRNILSVVEIVFQRLPKAHTAPANIDEMLNTFGIFIVVNIFAWSIELFALNVNEAIDFQRNEVD